MYTLCSILLHFVKGSLISVLAMDAFKWDKWILLAGFLIDFFSKLSGKHFIDHTLQPEQSPLFGHSTLILLQWRQSDLSISMYIHVTFGHAVKKHFETSSVISDQASMYMCSLVSVFCSRLFSVNS